MTSSTKKPNSRIKVISSWVAGIAMFAFLEFKLEEIASELGLITSFYFEGLKRGDYYEGVELTSLGWFLLFLKITISARFGMFLCYGNFKQGTGEHGNLLLLIFGIFFGLYAAIDTLLWDFSRTPKGLQIDVFYFNVANLIILVGSASAGYFSYQKIKYSRLSKLEQEEEWTFSSHGPAQQGEKKGGTILLFQGVYLNGGSVKVTFDRKNKTFCEETLSEKRSVKFDTSDEIVLQNFKVKIDELVRNEKDIILGLRDYLEKILKYKVRTELMSSSSSKAHANKNFDTERNVRAPKETRREVLVDAEEQLEAGSQGIRASLIHFDNGQIVLDGHRFSYSDERDYEYEFSMTVFWHEGSKFVSCLQEFKQDHDVEKLLKKLETEGIEPLFISWTS